MKTLNVEKIKKDIAKKRWTNKITKRLKKVIKQIEAEVYGWELEGFTNASYNDVVDDVLWNIENLEPDFIDKEFSFTELLEIAYETTNETITDGNL